MLPISPKVSQTMHSHVNIPLHSPQTPPEFDKNRCQPSLLEIFSSRIWNSFLVLIASQSSSLCKTVSLKSRRIIESWVNYSGATKRLIEFPGIPFKAELDSQDKIDGFRWRNGLSRLGYAMREFECEAVPYHLEVGHWNVRYCSSNPQPHKQNSSHSIQINWLQRTQSLHFHSVTDQSLGANQRSSTAIKHLMTHLIGHKRVSLSLQRSPLSP